MNSRAIALVVFTVAAAESSLFQNRPQSTNRLINESSPYLLLHARNPVDWFPWGEEAVELARKLDRPIFLSIGYSTCYWCHRMEEDVFENPEIAALMNRDFINIKVDREERPDLDEIYMTATQLMTRRGGWPNSLFLTPNLEPFFAGTYFPPEDRANQVGFPTILARVTELWTKDRERLQRSATRIAEGVERTLAARSEPATELPSSESVTRALSSLTRSFDEEWGGFGAAPKFPSPANLFLLVDRAKAGNAEASRMLVATLHRMGEGALYDHLGGGFHRYATDREWRVPHFEKMLYDNAALAEVLIDTARLTGDDELARLARGTLDFVLERLSYEGGGFLSAIDAQTNGHEGAFYVWSREELETALTHDELSLVAPIFGFDRDPNFEEELHTVYLTASLAEHAASRRISKRALLTQVEPVLAKLKRVRMEREFPLVDDKVLADWNGMMIAAMAKGGSFFDEPRYTAAARKTAAFVLDKLGNEDSVLRHVFRSGVSKIDGFLDDYAFMMKGLIALHRADENPRWLEEAKRLADELESHLRDPAGGYFQASPGTLVPYQAKGATDGAIPSGNGVAVAALLDLAEITGERRFRERGEAALLAFDRELETYPAATKTLVLSVARLAERAPNPDRLAASVVTANLTVEGDQFRVGLTIRDGWHVNANPASSSYLIPTEIQGSVRKVVYPEGTMQKFAFSPDALSVYGGAVVVEGTLGPDADSVELVYQACDETRCLSPVERKLEVPAR